MKRHGSLVKSFELAVIADHCNTFYETFYFEAHISELGPTG